VYAFFCNFFNRSEISIKFCVFWYLIWFFSNAQSWLCAGQQLYYHARWLCDGQSLYSIIPVLSCWLCACQSLCYLASWLCDGLHNLLCLCWVCSVERLRAHLSSSPLVLEKRNKV
jgi:hypothetical protein